MSYDELQKKAEEEEEAAALEEEALRVRKARARAGALALSPLPPPHFFYKLSRFALQRRKIIEKKPRARICKRLRSPGIDSKESIPPANAAWQAGTTNRVIAQARRAGNRFLDSLKGLQIRSQAC
jgi:hypothetical protein